MPTLRAGLRHAALDAERPALARLDEALFVSALVVAALALRVGQLLPGAAHAGGVFAARAPGGGLHRVVGAVVGPGRGPHPSGVRVLRKLLAVAVAEVTVFG